MVPCFPMYCCLQIGILENVKGILAVIDEVLSLLAEALPDYAISYTTLCPMLGRI